LVGSERDEVDDLVKLIKSLERQIEEETRRLQDAEKRKEKDIQFAEHAFYTSNEEGMGVSPNQYEGQNKMPKPRVRTRTPSNENGFGNPRVPVQIAFA